MIIQDNIINGFSLKVRFGLLLCFMESGGKLFQWKTSSYFLSFFLSFLFFFFSFFFFEIELFWLSGIDTIASFFFFFENHLNLMIKRHTLNSFFFKKKKPNLMIKNYQTKNYLIKSLKEGKYGPIYYLIIVHVKRKVSKAVSCLFLLSSLS